jgi:nicotinate phosphoribosyltransferase
MVGVRLDSGDLAYLSMEARKILDEAGFEKTEIVASNDLDESIIVSLKNQGARIGVWGVGTKLVTGYDQPALGGVYKLSAIRDKDGPWEYKVKLSEQALKVSNPGILQVRRYFEKGEAIGDMVYDEQNPPKKTRRMIDPNDATRQKTMPASADAQDLLVPVFRGGKSVYDKPDLKDIRSRVQDQLGAFHGGIKRFVNPHQYPMGLEQSLHKRRTELVLKARGHQE